MSNQNEKSCYSQPKSSTPKQKETLDKGWTNRPPMKWRNDRNDYMIPSKKLMSRTGHTMEWLILEDHSTYSSWFLVRSLWLWGRYDLFYRLYHPSALLKWPSGSSTRSGPPFFNESTARRGSRSKMRWWFFSDKSNYPGFYMVYNVNPGLINP